MLFYVRKTWGKSPPILVVVTLLMWGLLLWTLFAEISGHATLHFMEPLIALLYYLWASLFMCLEVANEVTNLPSDSPFQLSFLKARLSSMPVKVTKLENGQSLNVGALGLMAMISRLHEKKSVDEEDEEEEEEEEDEEDPDFFNIGRGTLDLLWNQSEVHKSAPFLSEEAGGSDAIFAFEVSGKVRSAMDWDEHTAKIMNGMDTDIDVGHPSIRSEIYVVFLALLNASIGGLHRYISHPEYGTAIVFGVRDGNIFALESTATISCFVVTCICSWIVFRQLFCTAFRWYMVLTIMQQVSKALTIDGATKSHMPCFIDLRHEGNLEGWFTAREYINMWCKSYVYGIRSQTIVASSLVVSALVAVNAVVNNFSDSENIGTQ